MKTPIALFAALALCPLVASAQPKVSLGEAAPQISIDPKAQALLDKATAKYKAASGIRFEVESEMDGKTNGSSSVFFERPSLLRVETKTTGQPEQIVGDGKNFYDVVGTSFHKFPASKEQTEGFLQLYRVKISGFFISQMLKGHNPLTSLSPNAKTGDVHDFKLSASSLSPQIVDGSVLSGMKLYIAGRPTINGKISFLVKSELILWFGNDLTLRRMQLIDTPGPRGRSRVICERIFNQTLNPIFPPDTFKFDATGLTLAKEDKSRS